MTASKWRRISFHHLGEKLQEVQLQLRSILQSACGGTCQISFEAILKELTQLAGIWHEIAMIYRCPFWCPLHVLKTQVESFEVRLSKHFQSAIERMNRELPPEHRPIVMTCHEMNHEYSTNIVHICTNIVSNKAMRCRTLQTYLARPASVFSIKNIDRIQ